MPMSLSTDFIAFILSFGHAAENCELLGELYRLPTRRYRFMDGLQAREQLKAAVASMQEALNESADLPAKIPIRLNVLSKFAAVRDHSIGRGAAASIIGLRFNFSHLGLLFVELKVAPTIEHSPYHYISAAAQVRRNLFYWEADVLFRSQHLDLHLIV